jgi:NAD(P)-dependent dehydrogenase (short-subunit alcohol dehydrogenase family)
MATETELSGKVVIITGGAEGIGKGMAARLASYGAAVMIASRNAETGEQAAAALRKATHSELIGYVQTDVVAEGSVSACVAATVERFGRLDAIVNNAVFPGDFKLLAEESAESFERVMQTNVNGVFYGMKHAILQFQQQGSRRGDNYSIINVSSGATRDTGMTMAPYIASKLAVEGLTQAGAREYASHGIRINTLLFGVFETEKAKALHDAMPQVRAKNAAKHHLGRFGDPEHDAGEAATFLISERSTFITGTTLFVDGGMCL